MSDALYYSRRFLREFIELYKNQPSLWKVQSYEYKDRHLKKKSYVKLVCKLREVDPRADQNCVRQKINLFRTSFRKEYKKKCALAQAGQNYTPNLWYYDLLLFLKEDNDVGSIEEPSNNFEEVSEGDGIEYVKTELFNPDTTMDDTTDAWENLPDDNNLDEQFISEQEKEDSVPNQEVQNISRPIQQRITHLSPGSSNQEVQNISTQQQIMRLSAGSSNQEVQNINTQQQITHLSPGTSDPPPCPTENECDYFGKFVATKLRRLPPKMLLISEKLIHDVLYQAELNNLNVNTFIDVNRK